MVRGIEYMKYDMTIDDGTDGEPRRPTFTCANSRDIFPEKAQREVEIEDPANMERSSNPPRRDDARSGWGIGKGEGGRGKRDQGKDKSGRIKLEELKKYKNEWTLNMLNPDKLILVPDLVPDYHLT